MKLFESVNMMSLFPGECQMALCVGTVARRGYGVVLDNNAESLPTGRQARHT